MQERRTVPRWQINREVDVLCVGAQGVVRGQVCDMNYKGVRLCLQEALPQQASLKMSLAIDQRFNMELEASIPWNRSENGQYLYGVHFEQMHDEDREKIYQYVSDEFPDQLRHQWWD